MSGQDSFEANDTPTGIDLSDSQTKPTEQEKINNRALKEVDAVVRIINTIQDELKINTAAHEFPIIFDAMMRVYYRERYNEMYD